MKASRFQPTDISFSNVAELFINELRAGVTLSVADLVKAFPHLEREIRDNIPALMLLEAPRRNSASLSERSASPEPPTIAGCTILSEIGRGAMGIVYEGIQAEINRRVAVKVIPLQTSEAMASRFEVEARALGRLDHPHITSVYSFGRTEKYAYIVMRLIEGHSLQDLQNGVSDYRFQYFYNELCSDWNVLAKCAADLASALQHAHDRGMVHRDIKPGNLLVDNQEKVWITDFGLAKVYDDTLSISRTGDAVGTPRYMAPEQTRGVCDARSDIYALGLTLYELASKQRVWDQESQVSLLSKRSSLQLTPIDELNPDVPPGLAKVLMKSVQFDPQDRYQSAAEMEVVLRRFLAGHRVTDRRKKRRLPTEEFERISKRNAWLLTGTATALACLGCTGWIAFNKGAQPVTSLPSPPSRVIPTIPAATELIDQMANEDSDDMLNIVTGYVAESIERSSEELKLSEKSRRELREHVQVLTDKIDAEGGISKESLDSFLAKFRQSSLPDATRVMRLSLLVDHSGLTPPEKQAAIVTLQRLASAVVSGWIPKPQLELIVAELTHKPIATAEDLQGVRVSDRELSVWLANVQFLMGQLPPEAFNVRSQLEDVLQTAISPPAGDR